MTTIRVNRDYLEWAHGPSAEDGHPPAVRIIEACEASPGRLVGLDMDDAEIRAELHQVADLWDHRETEDHNPSARRTARRIMDRLGPYRYQRSVR